MITSNLNLESTKKRYEASLINREHAEWTLASASFTTRMLHKDQLQREAFLREQYDEEARQLAAEIHAMDPVQGPEITFAVERDVDQYMVRRKADWERARRQNNSSRFGRVAADETEITTPEALRSIGLVAITTFGIGVVVLAGLSVFLTPIYTGIFVVSSIQKGRYTAILKPLPFAVILLSATLLVLVPSWQQARYYEPDVPTMALAWRYIFSPNAVAVLACLSPVYAFMHRNGSNVVTKALAAIQIILGWLAIGAAILLAAGVILSSLGRIF